MILGNIALYKPTDQDRVFNGAFSSNAVDGGKQTNYQKCAHTLVQSGATAWWRVDLGQVEDVAEVHILNINQLADRLDNASIRVGQ